jgi:subtilisin family serine protease
MDIPAAYPFVVGISATNMANGPACYSNMGDVASPGGDAAPGVDASSGAPICVSKAVDCPTGFAPGQCPYGVMGLSTLATSSGFAYWSGTSFAAPIASGLAALLLEHQATGRPDLVRIQMVAKVDPIGDPRFGTGVINVIEALK